MFPDRPVSDLEYFSIVLVALFSIVYTGAQFRSFSRRQGIDKNRLRCVAAVCALAGSGVGLLFNDWLPLAFALGGVPLGIAYARGDLF